MNAEDKRGRNPTRTTKATYGKRPSTASRQVSGGGRDKKSRTATASLEKNKQNSPRTRRRGSSRAKNTSRQRSPFDHKGRLGSPLRDYQTMEQYSPGYQQPIEMDVNQVALSYEENMLRNHEFTEGPYFGIREKHLYGDERNDPAYIPRYDLDPYNPSPFDYNNLNFKYRMDDIKDPYKLDDQFNDMSRLRRDNIGTSAPPFNERFDEHLYRSRSPMASSGYDHRVRNTDANVFSVDDGRRRRSTSRDRNLARIERNDINWDRQDRRMLEDDINSKDRGRHRSTSRDRRRFDRGEPSGGYPDRFIPPSNLQVAINDYPIHSERRRSVSRDRNRFNGSSFPPHMGINDSKSLEGRRSRSRDRNRFKSPSFTPRVASNESKRLEGRRSRSRDRNRFKSPSFTSRMASNDSKSLERRRSRSRDRNRFKSPSFTPRVASNDSKSLERRRSRSRDRSQFKSPNFSPQVARNDRLGGRRSRSRDRSGLKSKETSSSSRGRDGNRTESSRSRGNRRSSSGRRGIGGSGGNDKISHDTSRSRDKNVSTINIVDDGFNKLHRGDKPMNVERRNSRDRASRVNTRRDSIDNNPERDLESNSSDLKSLKVVVAPEDYPRKILSKKEADFIKMALATQIRPSGAEGTGPQFHGINYEHGTLVVSCKNQQTKDWIQDLIPKLQGVNRIKVIDTSDAGHTTVKAIVWAPNPLASKNPKVILNLLKSQNVGLQTDHWRVVSTSEKTEGVTLVVFMNNEDIKALQKYGMRPCLGLSKARIKLVENKRPNKNQ